METVANNIANANSTRSENGEPFRRKQLVFSEMIGPNGSSPLGMEGVRVVGVKADQTPFPVIYSPGHDDADEFGNLRLSNVKLPNEMVDMITASRSYEANLKALTSFKDMVEQTLTLLRLS